MMKRILSLSFLLALTCSPCFSQSMVKARVVSVSSNSYIYPIVTSDNVQGAISNLIVKIKANTNDIGNITSNLSSVSNDLDTAEATIIINTANITGNSNSIDVIQAKRVNIGPMTGTINDPSIFIAADDSYAFVPAVQSTGYSIDNNGREVFMYIGMDGPRKVADAHLMYAARDYTTVASTGMRVEVEPKDMSRFEVMTTNNIYAVINASKFSIGFDSSHTNTYSYKRLFVIHDADTNPDNWNVTNMFDVTGLVTNHLLDGNGMFNFEYVSPDLLGTAVGDGRIIFSSWADTGGGTGDFPVVQLEVFEEDNFRYSHTNNWLWLTNIVTTNSSSTDIPEIFDLADISEGGWVDRKINVPDNAAFSHYSTNTYGWHQQNNYSFYNATAEKFVLYFGGRERVKDDDGVIISSSSAPQIVFNNSYDLSLADLVAGSTSWIPETQADLKPSSALNTNFYKWAHGESWGTSIQALDVAAPINSHNNDLPGTAQSPKLSFYHDPFLEITRAFAGTYGLIYLTDMVGRPLHTLMPKKSGIIYEEMSDVISDYSNKTLFNGISERPFKVVQSKDDYWTRFFVSIFGAGFGFSDMDFYHDLTNGRAVVVSDMLSFESDTGYSKIAAVMQVTNSWTSLFGDKDVLEPEVTGVRYLPADDNFSAVDHTAWAEFPDLSGATFWTSNLLYRAIMNHDFCVAVEDGSDQTPAYYLLYPGEAVMKFEWFTDADGSGNLTPRLRVWAVSPEVIFPAIDFVTPTIDFFPFAVTASFGSTTNWSTWLNGFTDAQKIDLISNLGYDKANTAFYATGVDVNRTTTDDEWRIQQVYVYTNGAVAWEKGYIYDSASTVTNFTEAFVDRVNSLSAESSNGEIYNNKRGCIITENGWYIPSCSSLKTTGGVSPGVSEGYRIYRSIDGNAELNYLPLTSAAKSGFLSYDGGPNRYSFNDLFGYSVTGPRLYALTSNIDADEDIVADSRLSWFTSRDYPADTNHLSYIFEGVLGTDCELGAITLDALGSGVTNIEVSVTGTGYVSAVVGIFDLGGLGSNATATVELDAGGAVTNIVMTAFGTNYVLATTFASVVETNPDGFFGQLNITDADATLTEHSLLAQGPSGLAAYILPGPILLGGYYYDDIAAAITTSQVNLSASESTYIYATASSPTAITISTSRFLRTTMSYNTVVLAKFVCDADSVTSSVIYSHYLNVTTSTTP